MSINKQHDTVGWHWHNWQDVYLCFKYEKSCGFWMRLVKKNYNNKISDCNRKVGDTTCISERAIGRTFHQVHSYENYVEHPKDCECYVCFKD